MFWSDNTTVVFNFPPQKQRKMHQHIAVYVKWCRENNIKYTLIYDPVWNTEPMGINLRNEDALMFKLRFNFK
jgi:hypothetical protein